MEEFMARLRDLAGRARNWLARMLKIARDGRAADDDGGSDRAGPRSGGPRRAPSRGIDPDADVVVATREDDVSSVVGRINTAETMEVVLYVQRDARALRRATAWPHIAAHVRRRGIELGVVSPRRDVRSFAKENGLRTGRNVRDLRPSEYRIRIGGRDFVVPPVPWGRLIRAAMIVVFLGVVFIASCYQVPSAEIRLTPQSEEFTASGEARANAIIEASDLDTQTITADSVRRQIFTAVTTTTTGEVEIGDEYATLRLEFTNNSTSVMLIPVGTRVSDADGIAFLTDENLDVPAESTASVSATAEFPGEPGNVPVDTVTEAEGIAGAITVTNPVSGSGGTNKLTAGVSQADVDRVREIAADILDRVARATLLGAVEAEGLGTLLPESVTAAVFSEQPVQLLDEASDVLVVEYTLIAAGLVVTPEQASDYGERLIRRQLPDGLALIPGSVVATITPPAERGARMRIDASGRVASLAGVLQVANRLTGKSPDAARALLEEELDLEEPPQIEIHPNFIPWLWLPRRASNIEIIIAGPAAEEASAGGGDATATPTDTPTASGG